MERGSALSIRQRDCLRAMNRLRDERGDLPSIREIAAALRLRSPATVAQHVRALERKGFARRVGRRWAPVAPARGVPIVGRVAAGRPILAEEHRDGALDPAELWGRGGTHFAVRVTGDSMVEAGIRDGDLVVVRAGERVEEGEVGVFYVGEEQEATVKVFRRLPGGGAALEPRSVAHRAIEIAADDPHFRAAGRVVGLVRRL